jgi:hypothetical protein
MFDFPSNPFSADALGRAFLIGVVGWAIIWKWLSKNAPSVTDFTKEQGKKKAISLIGKWLK